MPSPYDEKVAAYLALSNLNDLALAAFTAKYPLITVGATFTETIGIKWKVRYIYADRNQAMFMATFVDPGPPETDTSYTRMFYSPEPQMLWFDGNFTDVLTTQPGSQVINVAAARFGEVIDIDIDGITLSPATYSFDSATGDLTLTAPTTAGQLLNFNYRTKPYSYGYNTGI